MFQSAFRSGPLMIDPVQWGRHWDDDGGTFQLGDFFGGFPTMPCLPPMTGNGLYHPFMVILRFIIVLTTLLDIPNTELSSWMWLREIPELNATLR